MNTNKALNMISAPIQRSRLENQFLNQILLVGIPIPEQEFKFAPGRRWRFDFAWPDIRLAVEVEGGSWSGGRHTTGAGFEADCMKYQEAMLLGWDVYRVTSGMIKKGIAIETIKKLLEMKGVFNETT